MIKTARFEPFNCQKKNEGVHFVKCIRFVDRKSSILWFVSIVTKYHSSRTVITRHAVSRIFSNRHSAFGFWCIGS